jgi:hypothetical protein
MCTSSSIMAASISGLLKESIPTCENILRYVTPSLVGMNSCCECRLARMLAEQQPASDFFSVVIVPAAIQINRMRPTRTRKRLLVHGTKKTLLDLRTHWQDVGLGLRPMRGFHEPSESPYMGLLPTEMGVLVHATTRSGVAAIQTTRASRDIRADSHRAASESIHFLSELQSQMRGVSIRAKRERRPGKKREV